MLSTNRIDFNFEESNDRSFEYSVCVCVCVHVCIYTFFVPLFFSFVKVLEVFRTFRMTKRTAVIPRARMMIVRRETVEIMTGM